MIERALAIIQNRSAVQSPTVFSSYRMSGFNYGIMGRIPFA